MRYDQIRLPGKHIIVPEVSEFLGLIENAELILTDSFHATAFSINFNKNFYVVYPNKFNSRIEDLLVNLNLQGRRVNIYDENRGWTIPIKYEFVNKKLDELRKESISNLSKALRLT